MSRPSGTGRLVALVLLVLLGLGGVAALVVESQDAEHLAARGRQALDDNDLPRAEARFRQALARDPVQIGALAGLGWTYLLAGEPEAAQAAFERCGELAPDQAECLRGQASVDMAQGQPTKARVLLVKALQLAPDDPKVQSSMGLLELSDGDIAGGAARYESLVARFPDDAEYHVGLVEARLRQKRLVEALSLVDRALALEDTPVRTVATLYLQRARVLVASVADRADPQRCAETVPPLLAWLDAADHAVQAAADTGVRLPTQGDVQRAVGRSRGMVQDACPGFDPGEVVAAPSPVAPE